MLLTPEGGETPSPQALTPHSSPPHTWHLPISFLSRWVCLFWMFHVNGITYNVAFRVWLLIAHRFSRFLRVGAYISALFLFVVAVQLLSCVRLFATRPTAAHQASLSFTVSRSLLKLMAVELMLLSNRLILCCPFLLCLQLFLFRADQICYFVKSGLCL